MTEKIKRFFGKYLILIMFFVLICIGVVYLIIPKTTHIYLSGFAETVSLFDFTGNLTFNGDSMGDDSINDIMGVSIENIVPIKINIDGDEFEVDAGELQIDINSNDKNYISNLIQFESEVEYTIITHNGDIRLDRGQINIECEDEIIIDLKEQKRKFEIYGVYNIYINNKCVCEKIDSNSVIEIESTNSKCLRCYHMKKMQCNNTSNVYYDGNVIDIDATFEQGKYLIDQNIFQNEEEIQLVDVSLCSLNRHSFNIKRNNKNDTLSISGYAKKALLDDENLAKYGFKWIISNFTSCFTYIVGIFMGIIAEYIRKKCNIEEDT